MLGAIIGDIVGSIYEFKNIKTKDFPLFRKECSLTDDSIMTLAIASSLLECHDDYFNIKQIAISNMQFLGQKYPRAGYGGNFLLWLYRPNPKPYNSFGNGAIMRVSPCNSISNDYNIILDCAIKVTEISHNHPQSLKAVEALTKAIFMAKNKNTKEDIKKEMQKYYNVDTTLNQIRPSYRFDVSCDGTIVPAIIAFLESSSFEDAIRNAISLGGDSDTLAAVTGSIAEAYYGIPEEIKVQALTYFDEDQLKIYHQFVERYYEN